MAITGGATIWARRTIDSEIFYNKPAEWFKIWFYIVNKVNYKDTEHFKRGEGFFKYEAIQEQTGAKRHQVDHCVRFLKQATQIATRKATRGFYITVLNYDLYQNIENYKSDTESETKSVSQATRKRHESDTIYSNKVKNVKKEIYTSKNSVTPCTTQELQDIATKLKVSLEAVRNKHSVILNKIEAKEYKNKTVYLTLENWLLGDIDKGYIKRITSSSIAAKYPLYQPKAI